MPCPVISLKPSYNSITRGCPGIYETLPRIECELRIRSNDGRPIFIERIEVMLKTTEVLNSTGPSFTSKPKLEKETIHYKKNIKLSHKKIIGIDIPLTIGLPDDIKETNYNKFGYTFTCITCVVLYRCSPYKSSGSDSAPLSESFKSMVHVERYNLLASSELSPPLKRTVTSADKKFQVSYSIKNPCLATEDVLEVEVELIPNLVHSHRESYSQKIFNKKVKLKSIVLEFKEFLEVYESHMDGRDHTLQTDYTPYNTIIGESGVNLKTQLDISTKNSLFKEFEKSMNEPTLMYQVPHHEQNLESPIPETVIIKSKNKNLREFQYHRSISSRGKLFSVTHGLVIKFKISHGKDFEVYQPLDITAWPKSSTALIEQFIANEREVANRAKSFYDAFGGIRRNKVTGILEYPPLPPVVYAADIGTMEHLGVIYTKGLKYLQRIPIIE